MLKALTAELRSSGHTALSTWKAMKQAEAEEAGYRSVAARHVDHVLGKGIETYHHRGNEKLPRAVDHDLEMFGCVACNFCVTVCPNDAFFNIKSLDSMDSRQEYFVFAELCNECGNCMVFCPEDGDPAQIKPKLFTDPHLFAARDGQGFLIGDSGVVEARADDETVSLVQRLLAGEQGLPLQEIS
jgi:putative selenate reductase